MSKENVRLFYEVLSRDKVLQTRFAAINQKYQGQKPTEAQKDQISQQELIPLAKEAGYDFTLAELKAYARETSNPAGRELSEEEIAAVAGGRIDGTTCACVAGGTGCTCITSGAGSTTPGT